MYARTNLGSTYPKVLQYQVPPKSILLQPLSSRLLVPEQRSRQRFQKCTLQSGLFFLKLSQTGFGGTPNILKPLYRYSLSSNNVMPPEAQPWSISCKQSSLNRNLLAYEAMACVVSNAHVLECHLAKTWIRNQAHACQVQRMHLQATAPTPRHSHQKCRECSKMMLSGDSVN